MADFKKFGESQTGQKYVSASESLVAGYVVDEQYNVNKAQTASLSLWTPLSIPSSALQSGGVFFDTEITSESYIHFLSSMWIELTIKNNDVNPLTLVPTRWLFNRIEIYMGSNLLQQFYAHELWNYLLLSFKNEELANLTPAFTNANADMVENFNPTPMGTNTRALAAGASLNYSFLLPKTILHSSVFLPNIQGGRIKVRCYLNAGSQIYAQAAAPATPPSLVGARVLGTGFRLAPEIFNKVQNFYATNKVISRFAYSRQQIQSQSPGAATSDNVQFPLNSFLGSFSFMCFWLRYPLGSAFGSANQGETQYTMIQPTNWSLINSSGQPQYSSTQLVQYIFSSMVQTGVFPSFSGSIANGQMAIYNYSQAPFQALQSGLNYGSEFSNGLWTLRCTEPIAHPIEVVCVASELALCSQESGTLVAYYL